MQVHDLFGDCGDEALPPAGKDVSAEQWMRAKGCSERQMAVADACYANDFGCSLRQLGVREMVIENRNWDDGRSWELAGTVCLPGCNVRCKGCTSQVGSVRALGMGTG